MFIALYRWRVKEGQEKNFLEDWHRRTEEIYQHCGSLGSRLHRAEDGVWVAYAQWPDRRTYDAAQSIPVIDAPRLTTACTRPASARLSCARLGRVGVPRGRVCRALGCSYAPLNECDRNKHERR
jgi:quinol monooxygenase YgiN